MICSNNKYKTYGYTRKDSRKIELNDSSVYSYT